MYKACIFDLDGTLTDTLDSLTLSVNRTLGEMDLPEITKEQCEGFVGNGARVLMEKSLAAVGETSAGQLDRAMEIYRRIFDDCCTYHVVPYEGITELLEELKSHGVELAVLSNKPHQQAVHVVGDVFGKEAFRIVQGQKEGVPRKPDPMAALQIAELLGTKPQETVYIGDSEVDAATGRAAKMLTIGVTWGFRDRQVLESAGADRIVDHPSEISELLLYMDMPG